MVIAMLAGTTSAAPVQSDVRTPQAGPVKSAVDVDAAQSAAGPLALTPAFPLTFELNSSNCRTQIDHLRDLARKVPTPPPSVEIHLTDKASLKAYRERDAELRRSGLDIRVSVADSLMPLVPRDGPAAPEARPNFADLVFNSGRPAELVSNLQRLAALVRGKKDPAGIEHSINGCPAITIHMHAEDIIAGEAVRFMLRHLQNERQVKDPKSPPIHLARNYVHPEYRRRSGEDNMQ